MTSSHSKAFTFIELLMTVSIMIISLSIGIINYLRFLDKQGLYQSGSQIESIFKDARSKAQSGFLGNEEIGFCDKLAAVEVFSSITAESKVSFTAQLRCANGDLLVYDNYLITQAGTSLSQSFKISFLPMRGSVVLLDSTSVASGSAILTRNNSDITFNLDQGGNIDVRYE